MLAHRPDRERRCIYTNISISIYLYIYISIYLSLDLHISIYVAELIMLAHHPDFEPREERLGRAA